MACLVLTLASAAAAAGPGHATASATATTEVTIPGGEPEINPDLPRTDNEAEERDNGHTAQAPYLIWSGIISVVVVGGGGLLFKRRYDRENRAVLADVAAAKASAGTVGGPGSGRSAN